MTKNNYKDFLAILTVISISLLIFWKFFINGLLPFPGDYLLAWYEPWKSQFMSNGTITIAHKPIASDIFRQLYPFKALGMKIIKNFQLPLWNPYNGAGMPLLATMHVGFLNPFNFLFFLFPNYFAWSLQVILQPLLIAIATYVYARKIRLSIAASIFSACSFLFSGFVIIRSIFTDYDFAIFTLPLMLYLVEDYFKNRASKKIFLLPLFICFMFFSVQPQIIFYILFFCIAYIFFRYKNIRNRKRISIRDIFFLIGLFIIGMGLSSVQLFLTIELFNYANIDSDSSKFIFDKFLLPAQHFITILIPNYFGNPATYNHWGAADYIETIASIGSIPCLFALFSFWKNKMEYVSLRTFFAITTVITIILSLKWIGTELLYRIPLPIIATSIPSRILFLTSFSLAILAGFGFQRIQNTLKLSKEILFEILLFSCSIIAIVFGTFMFYKLDISCNNQFVLECRTIALRNTAIETIIYFLGLGILVAYFFIKSIFVKRFLLYSTIAVICIIGLYNSNKFLPFSPKQSILPENELITIIKKLSHYDRVLGIGEATIKTDFATYFNFYDPNYYDPLYIRRYGGLVTYSNLGKANNNLLRSDVEITSEATLSASLEKNRNRLLQLLGVKYIILKNSENSHAQKIVWRNNTWQIIESTLSLPHAYLVDAFKVIPQQKILPTLFSDSFNPQQTVLLEKQPILRPEKSVLKITKVDIVDYEENQVIIHTTAETRKLLVLSDNYYPGWKAFVDGIATPVYRANYSFRAIVIPKGNHTVRFAYQPLSAQLGMVVSFLFGGVYIFVIFWKKVRR